MDHGRSRGGSKGGNPMTCREQGDFITTYDVITFKR
jgi:hypothetical protein